MSERLWDILGASDDPAEEPHARWRRRLHRFCENWIFALVIAFGIRHFALELFRIPSASMEPALLGDPGLGKGDFVVVDKLTARFRAVGRWDVAVFQYPVPEVESSKGGRARPAVSADGTRLDHPVLRPVLGGNFVKRAVVLPGEEFYIQGGDVFLRDGPIWTVARKPADLQERLWQAIYRAGAQPGYVPWVGQDGAGVEESGASLTLSLPAGAVRFTQPLRNVYLKDGSVAVRPYGSQDAWTRVDGVSMLRPRFAWSGGANGSIWDLDRWELKRLTSADEDDPNRRGTPLNQLMTEWTGDLRVTAVVGALDGEAVLTLESRAPGAAQAARSLSLTLRSDGWRLAGGGAADGVVAEGPQPPVGSRVSLASIDGEAVVVVGSDEVRLNVPWVDPNLHRPTIVWSGAGRIALDGLIVERDLHYCAKGFLMPAPDAAHPERVYAQLADRIPDSEDLDNTYAGLVALPRLVRGQLLGLPGDELSVAQATRPIGTGPDNPARAPDGGYLMLGDNSPLSLDGREWGFVPEENLRGRGFLVVFPPQRWKVIR